MVGGGAMPEGLLITPTVRAQAKIFLPPIATLMQDGTSAKSMGKAHRRCGVKL
jgi:hypothetical protein